MNVRLQLLGSTWDASRLKPLAPKWAVSRLKPLASKWDESRLKPLACLERMGFETDLKNETIGYTNWEGVGEQGTGKKCNILSHHPLSFLRRIFSKMDPCVGFKICPMLVKDFATDLKNETIGYTHWGGGGKKATF